MECDICGTPGSSHRPLHCVTCAIVALESPLIEHARALIERDNIGKIVEAVARGSEDKASQHVSLTDSRGGGILVDRHECTKNLNFQQTKAEVAELEDRIGFITGQADLLRQRMETTKRELVEKRAAIAQKKSDLSSATYGIESRRANEADKVQQSIKRTEYKSEKVHQDTVEMRTYLCNTAAKLAGLKMTRRRVKDGGIKEVYSIGPGSRLQIHDLRNLHEAQADNISASLGAVANLLVRVSAYLGVRLPAEITLPHGDYPLATIFQPGSSYQGKRIPFPGTTPSHSSSNSPEASRTLENRAQLPKPRTLFVDRPINHLAAEDPREYSLFIEGVCLLAYNIAWLCRTQGMIDEFDMWENVCPMGRNLHRLLILQETRKHSMSGIVPTNADGKSGSKGLVALGELSHATSHSFLNAAPNPQYLGAWKLTPTKITDELKAYLTAEQQAQEWDVLKEQEWGDMEDIMSEDPVVVGEKRKELGPLDNGRSFLASTIGANKQADQSDDGARSEGKKRGVSGWTKVKSRTADDVKHTIPD